MSAEHPRLALGLVITEGFLGRLTFGMVSFGLPLYAASLGLSLGEIGLLISLRTVVAVVLKPVAGWLADRTSVRTVYLGGTAARVVAAAALLAAGSLVGLCGVRLLQGASAAGRDVASLSVITRDASHRVGSIYSWYATAKHVGGVGGAAAAGGILAATDNSYQTLFAIVLVLSVLPVGAAWRALREVPDASAEGPDVDGDDQAPRAGTPWSSALALARELRAPATLGMLVATSAYMVHGLLPLLATEHAGLTPGQTGAIYTLSAVVFLVSGPIFGWTVDRFGHVVGTTWRSVANIGSSVVFMVSPTPVGFAAAKTLDDSGKAAFRPAWATMIGDIANRDRRRRNRRLGVLDTSESVGEAIGPALAGILWQTGGIFVLFGARIAIAVAAEVTAVRLIRADAGRIAERTDERGAEEVASMAASGSGAPRPTGLRDSTGR